MEIIVGTIICKEDKILMIKESKKECYGKWNFPGGHLEKNENIFEGACREALEETGYKVLLKKIFPILQIVDGKEYIIIYFLADIEENTGKYIEDEILERKWISIEKIKEMQENEVRNYNIKEKIIESIEQNKLFPLDVIDKNILTHR